MLEHCIRDELNNSAKRVMAVLEPLKVVIENYPEGKVEYREINNHPKKEEMGKRKVIFSRTIYIERSDFMENPPAKYFRLSPGKEVRLMGAYFIKCKEVIKDKNGEIIELRCTYDPETETAKCLTAGR